MTILFLNHFHDIRVIVVVVFFLAILENSWHSGILGTSINVNWIIREVIWVVNGTLSIVLGGPSDCLGCLILIIFILEWVSSVAASDNQASSFECI